MNGKQKQLDEFGLTKRDPHPEYGYDRNKVPGVKCLICDEPIGDEEYLLDTFVARFGMMFFVHKRCVEEDPKLSKSSYEEP